MGPSQMLLSITLALCQLLLAVHARFEVEQGGLRVDLPKEKRQRFDMALANFGAPKYGASFTGRVVYPSSSSSYGLNCTDKSTGKITRNCQHGCTNFTTSLPDVRGTHYIMVLDRGGPDGVMPCTFLEKVLVAQQAGAHAAIIADNRPGVLLTMDIPEDDTIDKLVEQLHISAAFITQDDGKALKDVLAFAAPGPVVVSLNWTDILPKEPMVNWEFWTNSNDQCGEVCYRQQDFIKEVKTAASVLQQKNATIFTPHYLIWSCRSAMQDTPQCEMQCIRKGLYCIPDPDGDLLEGYSGKDVLMMNVRSLCVYNVSTQAGQPWMWWDFAEKLGENCKMDDDKFTEDCAREVFISIGGDKLLNNTGMQAFNSCINIGDVENDQPLDLLEREFMAQDGDDESTVVLMPTIRINGRQYRGTLRAGDVMRAICSAIPNSAGLPDVCNEDWVSEDECKPGGVGDLACKAGHMVQDGRTKCINTFQGYDCSCTDGFTEIVDPNSDTALCVDVNECLMTDLLKRFPNCTCDRCACINKFGGFDCTGPLQVHCAAADFGGCWHEKIGNTHYSACKDDVASYKQLAAQGALLSNSSTYRCECPKCFKSEGDKCIPKCDLKDCDAESGVCVMHMKKGQEGPSAVVIFFIVLTAVAITAAGSFMAYRWHLQRQMRAEIRELMAEYVPLDEMPEEQRGPGYKPRRARKGRQVEQLALMEDGPSDSSPTSAAPGPQGSAELPVSSKDGMNGHHDSPR